MRLPPHYALEAHPKLLLDAQGRQDASLVVHCTATGAVGVVLGGVGLTAEEEGVSCFFPALDGYGRWPYSGLLVDLRREETQDRIARVMWPSAPGAGLASLTWPLGSADLAVALGYRWRRWLAVVCP